ncbi:hypothetical protein HU200_005145 [Digitaria exilis]|uniref:Mixed lineage kinase domain-containing protein n=1 Tax=Digitaria exilis TaxID=1010633 RepID=A0A835FV77_9POAL|nr:hypothetical protein HU200_005145 [Digitaria exilis]
MPVEWATLALVGPLLRLASVVTSLAENARRYRRKCALLQDRVRVIVQHLNDLQRAQCTPDPPAMRDTLECLRQVLVRAQVLLQSCQRKKNAFDFLKARKNTGEFTFLNERITNLMESFHVANRTLIMGLYSDQIFVVVLRMLLQSDAGSQVLQHNRAVVQKCINEFPSDVDNMTPEKMQVLDLIKGILTLGPSSQRQGAAVNHEYEITEVENIAKDIVLKADAMNHKEEIHRVAQLARHVLFFLPNLRFPQLTGHPDTRRYLTKLRLELHAANETIESRPLVCVGAVSVVTITNNFWKEQAKLISGHGNRIEDCLQSLTFVALNQLIRNNP